MYIHVESAKSSKLFNKNFQKGSWLVLYYSPACGHCHQFKPVWDEYRTKYGDRINIAEVKDDYLSSVVPRQEVFGYPTIKLYKDLNELKEFANERTVEQLYKFTKSNFNKVLKLNSKKNKKKSIRKLVKSNKK
jgi:thioredoxin-like negative regulator of GroEL